MLIPTGVAKALDKSQYVYLIVIDHIREISLSYFYYA